ncbi:hypothetical protein EV360DRAFT_97769 [Lentinula raphanica]|nr:hypothetical protein EV360DRAFT_97769 [Lentinula raphanica]
MGEENIEEEEEDPNADEEEDDDYNDEEDMGYSDGDQEGRDMDIEEGEIVTSVRPSARTNTSAVGGATEDGYEPSLQVPNSVLDACQQSFTAADGSREKATVQFFDSTALMAMLCRHDRVLWIHYAFALIDQLFKNIPPTFRIGVLYDIGCSIHCSCVKWGFLGEYLDRITFAISVFHAYEHGWPCQCIYHPRKCEGFGLSDGEGCERFWHSISNLLGFGDWLAQKWRNTQAKYHEADNEVANSGQDALYLREQWKTQVTVSTKPLPRQSKNTGKTAIEEAICLRKIRDTLQDRISALEDIITDVDSEVYEVAEAEEKLQDLRVKLSSVQTRLLRQEQTLGVADRTQYQHLATSPFIGLRMNAHALKLRLRKRLTSRKFERDQIERSFRRQQYNDRKVRTHTEDAVKQRDPGIQALARRYNALCNQMKDLLNARKAPRNAIAPQPIPVKELFNLDVDDAIWQDVGLDDAGDCKNPPAWLMDEDVRSGIKGILLRDRCDEEFKRLKGECLALCSWSSEEWQVVNVCIELQQRKHDLLHLCVVWRRALQSITELQNALEWGPSASEMDKAEWELGEEKLDISEENKYEDSEVEFSDFDDDDLDIGLVERLDALEEGIDVDDIDDIDDVDNY